MSDNSINFTNYWEKLVEQVRSDVAKINASSEWKRELKGVELEFGETSDGGYTIHMTVSPFTLVTFSKSGTKINLSVEIENSTPQRESLDVVEHQGEIVLERYDQTFVMTEQASQCILQPIRESLKQRALLLDRAGF